nr:hypothetical protein [Bradyrhizobium diazoefficiens]
MLATDGRSKVKWIAADGAAVSAALNECRKQDREGEQVRANMNGG